jgi:ribosomal 30S subunit maturation factor RimM
MADSDIEGEVVAIVVVEPDDVAGAYRASELMGATVVNDQDERIGTIDDFIIGRDDRVLFAVLQIGGFLGLGGRLVAVPYESLVIAEDRGKRRILLPGATRDALKNLPEFRYTR